MPPPGRANPVGRRGQCLFRRGVIAPIHGVGDGGHLGGVPDHPRKGCAAVQRLHHVGAGTLPKGADHAFARDQDLIALLILADNAFPGDPQALVTGVDNNIPFDLL